MEKYAKIIKDAYINNNLFFSRFLLNYEEKYGEIDEKLKEKIHKLEKDKSNEKLIDEISQILENYVKQYEIRIVDMTLREWDQAPWWWMNRFEKAILALYLKEAWIDVIELWFAANPADYHNINYILNNIWDWTNENDPYLSSLCRAHIWDVTKAIELLKRYDKPRIHIFYATSEKHMEAKVWEKAKKQGLDKEDYIIKSFLIALDKALELKKIKTNFELEVSFEDAWNTKKENLLKLSKIMIDRARLEDTKLIINLPSTLWDKTSQEMFEIFAYVHKWLLEYYKDYTNWELSAHNHNDNAEALAVSMAWVRWWAKNVETSLLGLWEWAGNTQTHTFFNKISEDWDKLWFDFLEIYKSSKAKMNLVWACSRLLENMFLVDLYTLMPYIWEYVHKNSSWVHAANWEVYRTTDSVEKYWAEAPKEFFSSRWGTNQVSKILKNFKINFDEETDSFKKIYILRIQREAEMVKTLYPATMYAIYQELKWNFKIKKILANKQELTVRIKVLDQELELVWQMEEENWQIAWIVNAINHFLWKNTQFDLLKVPKNRAITPLRKIINDFRNSWEYLKIPKLDEKIDKIIKESEIFELIKEFYYEIDMFYSLLYDFKSLKSDTFINEQEINYLQNFLNLKVKNVDEITYYINKFINLKNSLDKIIYEKNLTKKVFDEIFDKNKEIISKFNLQESYQKSKIKLSQYLEDKESFDNMCEQDGIVYVECKLNKRIVNSQAISKSLTKATVKAIIYAALKDIEEKIIYEKMKINNKNITDESKYFLHG